MSKKHKIVVNSVEITYKHKENLTVGKGSCDLCAFDASGLGLCGDVEDCGPKDTGRKDGYFKVVSIKKAP